MRQICGFPCRVLADMRTSLAGDSVASIISFLLFGCRGCSISLRFILNSDNSLGLFELLLDTCPSQIFSNSNVNKIYSSQNGFRFSEPDFTRNFDLSQSQNPRLSNTKALVLFNRKIKISGKRVLTFQYQTCPEIPKINSR